MKNDEPNLMIVSLFKRLTSKQDKNSSRKVSSSKRSLSGWELLVIAIILIVVSQVLESANKTSQVAQLIGGIVGLVGIIFLLSSIIVGVANTMKSKQNHNKGVQDGKQSQL